MADEFLRPGQKYQVCSAQAILNGGDPYTSPVIDLSMLKKNLVALQFELEDVAGAGSAKIEALLTLNGTDYVDALADVDGAFDKSDGSQLAKVAMDSIPAIAMKVKVTETGAADITVSVWAAGK